MKHIAFGVSLALLVASTAEAGLTADEARQTAEAAWTDFADRFAEETAAELGAGRIYSMAWSNARRKRSQGRSRSAATLRRSTRRG
jgi:hypothetical protein